MQTVSIGAIVVHDWRLQLPGNENYQYRSLSDITQIVIHHSAVDHDNTALEIADYHTRVLGWPGIGYHFLVHQDGVQEYVGDVLTIRYNVARRNQNIIGICLPGNFMAKPPGRVQLEAARDLIANLQYALGWFVPVAGHRDTTAPGFETSCPGNTYPKWQSSLK
ncbi:MAG: peptidoglycan recognition protein family protein [Chloroflexi bacterium]|nr:peptidoglycan recognition protein family protein [Chloroflexota bacterium]